MQHLKDLFGKVRPQIFLALCILGGIAYVGIMEGLNEVAVGCIAGVIALAKDVIISDA
jgi:hypothetical protein